MRAIVLSALLVPLIATNALAADNGVVRRPTTGCIDKGPMARAHVLNEQEDPAAAQVLLARGLRSGACRPFALGEPVIVEDNDILAGLVRVHTVGDPTPFWVLEKAVETVW